MRESKIEKWYCDELKKHGVENVKLGQNGWPDREFLVLGAVCFVEFKRPKERVRRENQKAKIKWLQDDGFAILEISEKSEEWLKKILHALNIRAKL